MKSTCIVSLLLYSAILKADLVLSGINIYSFQKESFVKNQYVVIKDEKIASISQERPLNLDHDTDHLNLQGLFLLPGIIEMHGHLPTQEYQGAEVDDLLTLFVTHGVTTVRSVLGGSAQLSLLDRIKNEDLLAPDLVLAGPGFSGGNTKSSESAVARIEQYADEGWQLVKIFNGLSVATYDAIITSARAKGMPVVGHVPRAVGIDHVLRSGQQTIEHLDGYLEGGPGEYRLLTSVELGLLADKTRAAGVGVVPTMKVWEVILRAADIDQLDKTLGLEYVRSGLVKKWRNGYKLSLQNRIKSLVKKLLGQYDVEVLVENRRRLLGAMADAGVDIYFGTDSPQTFSVPGASVVSEMLEMQRAGMTPQQILASATVKPGNLLSPYFKTGRIEPGYEADLVILKENPLENLVAFKKPVGVIINGRYLSESDISQKLEAIKFHAGQNYLN